MYVVNMLLLYVAVTFWRLRALPGKFFFLCEPYPFPSPVKFSFRPFRWDFKEVSYGLECCDVGELMIDAAMVVLVILVGEPWDMGRCSLSDQHRVGWNGSIQNIPEESMFEVDLPS